MLRDSGLPSETKKARWLAVTSVLLVALLLYNPFFTILSSSRDLSVKHPLSYRATLAGSELRRCMMDESQQPLIPGLAAAIAHAATLFSPSSKITLIQPNDPPGLLTQALCDSIWFRPPPVV
jgi:hypothetical protein